MKEFRDGKILIRLDTVIGNGAYSKVWKGYLNDCKKEFAIKQIELEESTYRCILEAAIMSSIVHPNISKAEFVYIINNITG